MERVTFLVEETNDRLSCMLNPETVLMQRSSGVRPRESLSGLINCNGKGDNPLLFTGAGHTTLELDLVFDVSINGSSIVSQDVRDLTKPIWDLAENYQRNDRMYRPSVCRFIWGKSWNIPGVISTVAEKLESFSSEGVPRRSWMRLKLFRMLDQPHSALNENDLWPGVDNQANNSFLDELNVPDTGLPGIDSQFNFVNPTPETLENSFERVDLKADRIKGHPSFWRDVLIDFNLENPLDWVKRQLPGHNDSSENSVDSSQ